MTGKSYSVEEKAGALADLLAGNSVTSIAAKRQISRNTVSRWRNEHPDLHAGWQSDVQTDLAECVLLHLQEQFSAQRSIMEQFNDQEWLSQQSAQQLAVAYGIISDKQVRILASVVPSDNQAEE